MCFRRSYFYQLFCLTNDFDLIFKAPVTQFALLTSLAFIYPDVLPCSVNQAVVSRLINVVYISLTENSETIN